MGTVLLSKVFEKGKAELKALLFLAFRFVRRAEAEFLRGAAHAAVYVEVAEYAAAREALEGARKFLKAPQMEIYVVTFADEQRVASPYHALGAYRLGEAAEGLYVMGLPELKDSLMFTENLVNLRLLLEPGIAEIAAQNATDEDIERLQRLCERVETKIHNGDRYIEDDIAFHTCIAESSKNLVVGQLIPIIDTAVMMFVNVTHKKLIDETIMTHRMIAEAIARHDPIGAKSAMVMHLNFNRTYIKKIYDGEDPDDGTVGMAGFLK